MTQSSQTCCLRSTYLISSTFLEGFTNSALILVRSHAKQSEQISSVRLGYEKERCWETRGLSKSDQMGIATSIFVSAERDFTPYLSNWEMVHALTQ
jgi:hypothetical protein